MNFHLRINESSQFNGWTTSKSNFKLNKKSVEEIAKASENVETKDINIFKDQIINLQDNVKSAQEKINVLQMASDILTGISGNLSELKELSLNKLSATGEVELCTKSSRALSSYGDIEKLQAKMSNILDIQDNNTQKVLTEFKNVSEKASRLVETGNIEENVEDVLTTVSCSKESLNKLRDGLINNIQSLNVTLENMISVDSRIRNVELANKVVDLTHDQIIQQAHKSISIQVKDTDDSISSLIN